MRVRGVMREYYVTFEYFGGPGSERAMLGNRDGVTVSATTPASALHQALAENGGYFAQPHWHCVGIQLAQEEGDAPTVLSHRDEALSALSLGRTESAKIHALLAIAEALSK